MATKWLYVTMSGIGLFTNKDQQPDLAGLKSFLKGRLAGLKVPKEYIVVDELPKHNAGKLLKREIKKCYG